jgi:glyoxylase-like metal-dependent hydrolase (beta-lactamase superfamily II)
MKAFWTLAMLTAVIALAAPKTPAAPNVLAAPKPRAGSPLFQPWINGVSTAEPEMQVQRYDADTFVIRQSIRSNFEGPFLYLLFGRDRAILLDTGAGGLKIRPTIEQVIAEWLAQHGRASIPLVVAHSHSHGDHHQGDVEFEERADTAVVGLYTTEVSSFFKITDWPNDIARYDLGGRILEIIPTPGHHASHIMVYDERTRLLFSGDALCACRLYIPTNQFVSYRESVDRVVAFTKEHPISHILGAHIEMTREAGKLIIDEAPSHPDEHVLELPASALTELQSAVHAMGDMPKQEPHKDFVIYPLPPRPLPPASPPPK